MPQLLCLKESHAAESRVALTPDVTAKLVKQGWQVAVESSAGVAASFPDAAYTAAGALVQPLNKLPKADVLLAIRPPTHSSLPMAPGGTLIVQTPSPAAWPQLAGLAPNVLALEKLPRTSRAQALDVLSSQANLAGYAAALTAAARFGGVLPPLSTAAGSIKPAKVLVLGVGVAGLQAIATFRRLGAAVRAFDVRPEVHEQILSLGAKPVVLEEPAQASGAGGYAVALSDDAQAQLAARLQPEIAASDVVLATAQVPGKPAPLLVSAAAVAAMRPGSVVVDMGTTTNRLQGLTGGNCPLSVADETIISPNGVWLIGETNYPGTVARQASLFWAQNMASLLALAWQNGTLTWADELLAAMHIVKDGKVA